MKIFLTGGTGFIGSHFIQQALDAGHVLNAQRRLGSQPRVPLAAQPTWIDKALDADFTEELKGCDVLVHMAAHTPNRPYAPLDECLYWNVVASSRLIQQANKAGVKKILIAGTCFEYGNAANGQEFVHPRTEMQPSLTYSISKAAATTALTGLARHLNLQMQVLRIFQVYGEGDAATRFWPSLRSAALQGQDFSMSTGSQVRDFIEVSAVAARFLQALTFENVELGRPHLYNVGTGHAQTLLDFARYWWKAFGASGQLLVGNVASRPEEVPRLVADIDSVYIV